MALWRRPSGSLELFQKCLIMEKDTSTIDTYSMCCLHYKAYTRLLIFAAPDMFAFCFFWSNMALLTFWVADPRTKINIFTREIVSVIQLVR